MSNTPLTLGGGGLFDEDESGTSQLEELSEFGQGIHDAGDDAQERVGSMQNSFAELDMDEDDKAQEEYLPAYDTQLGSRERPVVHVRSGEFFSVYQLLVSIHPVHGTEQLELAPVPKLDDLGDPLSHEDCVKEFVEHVYKKKAVLRATAHASGRVRVHVLEDPVDMDVRTRVYKADYLSGGLMARDVVITNTHGLRFLGGKNVGPAKTRISFVQIAKHAEFLAGPGCYKGYFDDSSYPRYVLSIPDALKDTGTVAAELAMLEDAIKGKELRKRAEAAIQDYVAGCPVAKGPITDEQLLSEEALDPDIVALTIRKAEEYEAVPIPGMNKMALMKSLHVQPKHFSVPVLWFDEAHKRGLAASPNPFISVYVVGAPPANPEFSNTKLEELSGDFILSRYKRALKAALKAKERKEGEEETGHGGSASDVDPQKDPVGFFKKAKETALEELRWSLYQTFSGQGLSISVGYVAAFNVSWDKEKQRTNDRRLVINDNVIGHTACTIPGNSGSLLYDPKHPPGCAIGLHTGPAAAPGWNKPITQRQPWGIAKHYDNTTVRPPWNHAVAFSSASSYSHLTPATLPKHPLPDDLYWTDSKSLGSKQLGPYVRYHEFHMYDLARLPKEFLAEPNVRTWIQYIVDHRSLWQQRLTRMPGTPSSADLDFLLKWEGMRLQLERILAIECDPHQLSRELRMRLAGPDRHSHLGRVSDYMDAHPHEKFDLTGWPFPFLKLRSWDALHWLIGRLRERDTSANYIPASILAEMVPPEKPPKPELGDAGSPGYKNVFPDPDSKA